MASDTSTQPFNDLTAADFDALLEQVDLDSNASHDESPQSRSTFEGVLRLWNTDSGSGYIASADFPGDVLLVQAEDLKTPGVYAGDRVRFQVLRQAGGVYKALHAVNVTRIPHTGASTATAPSARQAAAAARNDASGGERRAYGRKGGVKSTSTNVEPEDPAELRELVSATPAATLLQYVEEWFEATSMDRLNNIEGAATAGDLFAEIRQSHIDRTRRRRQFQELLRGSPEASSFVVWMFAALMRPTLEISAVNDERHIAAAQARAVSAYNDLLLSTESMSRLEKVLAEMGLNNMPQEEKHSMMTCVFLALCDFRKKSLDDNITNLPPFQPDFVPPEMTMNAKGLEHFTYIVGWLLFKLRCRSGGQQSVTREPSPALRFVHSLTASVIQTTDPTTLQQRTHIEPNEHAVAFGALVESLVYYLLDNFLVTVGPAILCYVKLSVLANHAIRRAWLELTKYAELPSETSEALLLLWVQYYMKSRQKEVLRRKGWLPRPQPSLRASLRSQSTSTAYASAPRGPANEPGPVQVNQASAGTPATRCDAEGPGAKRPRKGRSSTK